MNNHRILKLISLAIFMLFVFALAVPWHSMAASPIGAPVPGGLKFQMVNPFQFRPAFPDLAWDYFNGELNNPGPDSGHNFYEAALSLPDNIRITKIVVYFYDNSDQDLLAALWRVDPSTGSWLEMAGVSSSGAQDQYRNVTDTSINEPIVNQQRYSYLVELALPATGSNLRVAAVRIDYSYKGDEQ
jgi:hypothetical protein